MRLCIVGKYPPIEGGVSANTYWIARGLAERGHEVHVVTNADEVEDAYRIALRPADLDAFQPSFPGGGAVTVHNPEPAGRRSAHHIPRANPFVSRLAGLATDVIRRHGCEAILAYYFEPYGVAAWMASRWTDRPLLVKHAGSDLDRLARFPDLARTYREVLRDAAGIVTRPPLYGRFASMGVAPSRLLASPPFAVPAVFNPDIPPLEPPGAGDPCIGVYGKIGVTKGTFDLISALGRLRGNGRRFRLLAMVGAKQGRRMAPDLEEAGIADVTRILPFLPHWRVAAFIRTCAAVCFLERDFPIAIHGPIVPREVMACGTCLVLSGEIAGKNVIRDALVDGENVVLVDDPKDHAALAAALDGVLADPERSRAIGERGHVLSRRLERFVDFLDGWEEIFARAVRGAADERPPVERTLASVAPDLLECLEPLDGDIVADFAARPIDDEGPLELGIALCEFAAARVQGPAASRIGHVEARLRCALDSARDDTPRFPGADRLGGRPVTRESCGELVPVLARGLRVERFDGDGTAVLFVPSANLEVREFAINQATEHLLAMCDGSRTTGDVVRAVGERLGVHEPERIARSVLGALQELYDRDAVAFVERAPERRFAPSFAALAEVAGP